MWGGSYHWTTHRMTQAQREYQDALECMRAAARKEHRAMPRRARVLKDLVTVTKKLAEFAKMTGWQARKYGAEKYLRDTERWLRQYHRLNRMLEHTN